MQPYVIGIFSRFDRATAVALDQDGRVLGAVEGKSCSYVSVGRNTAQRRALGLIDQVIASFQGERQDCQCLFVGAAGIDSPKTKEIVTECFAAAHMLCPLICLNDGSVALYSTTKGLGVLSMAGKGSIAVGRNAQGQITRSGGYPLSVLGNEGSLQWIALAAMHLATQWLDGSVGKTPLLEKIDQYFHGLDIEKMTECANALRRRPIDTQLANLVMEAAQEGDEAAVGILLQGAANLFAVAKTCVKKLNLDKEAHFLSGLWGDLFRQSEIYLKEYTRLFKAAYPNCEIVFSQQDEAMSTAIMALDYLQGKIPYLNSLQ